MLSASFLPGVHRWWALVWLGLVLEGVGTLLPGWLGVVMLWIGAILVLVTVYSHRRTRKAVFSDSGKGKEPFSFPDHCTIQCTTDPIRPRAIWPHPAHFSLGGQAPAEGPNVLLITGSGVRVPPRVFAPSTRIAARCALRGSARCFMSPSATVVRTVV